MFLVWRIRYRRPFPSWRCAIGSKYWRRGRSTRRRSWGSRISWWTRLTLGRTRAIGSLRRQKMTPTLSLPQGVATTVGVKKAPPPHMGSRNFHNSFKLCKRANLAPIIRFKTSSATLACAFRSSRSPLLVSDYPLIINKLPKKFNRLTTSSWT